jgi:hypothetical protein
MVATEVNLTPRSETLAGSEKREGGKNNWNDHKRTITVWLVFLFALWVILTTVVAVIGRHSKSRKTSQPPVIAAVAKFDPEPASVHSSSKAV